MVEAARGAAPTVVPGPPGGSPRSASTLRTPASAYAPMTCAARRATRPTQVRCATGVSVVSRGDPLDDAAPCGRGSSRRRRRSPRRTSARSGSSCADRLPEHGLALVGLRREELERERPAAGASRSRHCAAHAVTVGMPSHPVRATRPRCRPERLDAGRPPGEPQLRRDTCGRPPRRGRPPRPGAEGARRFPRASRSPSSTTIAEELAPGGRRTVSDPARRRQAAAAGVLLLGLARRRRRRRRRDPRRGRLAGAAAGLRADPRRRDGRLRHPPRPPGRAPRLRRPAPRRRAGSATRSRSAPARRSCSATSAWSGPTSCSTPAACRPRRCVERAPVYDQMRTELMAGQYLDLLEQALRRRLDSTARCGSSATRARSTRSSARCSSAPRSPARRRSCSRATPAYGLPLGEAFQLRDDVLGVFGDPATTGKPAGDDLREGKRTVLVAMALRARVAGPGGDASAAGSATRTSTRTASPTLRDGHRATPAPSADVEALIAERTAEALAALDAARPIDARRAERAGGARDAQPPHRRGIASAHAHRHRTDRPRGRRRRRPRRAVGRAAPGRRRPRGHRARARGRARRPRRAAVRRTGYEFDTGPTVLTMPDLIADALGCVGEDLDDWLDLHPARPALPRATTPTARPSTCTPTSTRWPPRSTGSAGPARPPATAATSTSSASSTGCEMADFIDRNLDSPLDLLTPNLARLAAIGGVPPARSRRSSSSSRDPRTQRVFSFQAMYAGLSPVRRARHLRRHRLHGLRRRRLLPARAACTPCRGALAGAAEKHGVDDPLRHHGRRRSRPSAAGPSAVDHRRRRADPGRRRRAQPRPAGRLPRPAAAERAGAVRRLTLLAVLRPAARRVDARRTRKIAHHNIHFGRSWQRRLRRADRPAVG